jgi:hypothetical protein
MPVLAAFDRIVADGTPELLLVSGYSGVGKSSVVNEPHKVLVQHKPSYGALRPERASPRVQPFGPRRMCFSGRPGPSTERVLLQTHARSANVRAMRLRIRGLREVGAHVYRTRRVPEQLLRGHRATFQLRREPTAQSRVRIRAKPYRRLASRRGPISSRRNNDSGVHPLLLPARRESPRCHRIIYPQAGSLRPRSCSPRRGERRRRGAPPGPAPTTRGPLWPRAAPDDDRVCAESLLR